MNTQEINKDSNTYELGFLLVPFITAENIGDEVVKIKNLVTDKGGRVVKEGETKDVTLAYTISKNVNNKRTDYKQAYFSWFHFGIGTENLAALEKALKENAEIVRFLIIRQGNKKVAEELPVVAATEEVAVTPEVVAAVPETEVVVEKPSAPEPTKTEEPKEEKKPEPEIKTEEKKSTFEEDLDREIENLLNV